MKREKSRRFSLWRNLTHSIHGIIEVTRNETPMKADILLLIAGSAILIVWDISFTRRAVLFVSLLLPIFAELINSAIERVVDLVTEDYHDLAKTAKDAGSAVVFVALVITSLVWAIVFWLVYFGDSVTAVSVSDSAGLWRA
ncbi:MAG: diacylglycerol kinase [Helicobacteraceae bacterium]|jgi:diacylglycerol kinase (ATP)|nr:diacylglycerol kinase [Helicobacteraceae bacterium]